MEAPEILRELRTGKGLVTSWASIDMHTHTHAYTGNKPLVTICVPLSTKGKERNKGRAWKGPGKPEERRKVQFSRELTMYRGINSTYLVKTFNQN